MIRRFGLVPACLLLLGCGPVAAQGLIGGFDREPEAPPTVQPAPSDPAPAAPPPATSTPATSTPAGTFPALAGCEQSLAGLPAGDADQLAIRLAERVAFWEGLQWETLPSFRHPRQAQFAFDCFSRRITLLASYVRNEAEVAEARSLAADLRSKWAGRLEAFLSGDVPRGVDARAWWKEADEALGALVATELAVGRAAHATRQPREEQLAAGRAALAELGRTIDSVRATQETFDARERQFWLRALAWRVRAVGLSLDQVQVADLRDAPEQAYAHLAGAADGQSTEDSIAGDLSGIIARATALRRARGELDPGAPRDWSRIVERRRLAEEIYLLHVMEQTMESRIRTWQRGQAERERARLQLLHEAEVARGVPEATSRAARDAEWASFKQRQKADAEAALRTWQWKLRGERTGAQATAGGLIPREE